jgi:hypothetical protein
MIGNYSARLTGSKRNLLALLASSAIFTAGCANMATTASTANPFTSGASLSGKVHGGNQPVSGATVTLFYAGQKGSSGFPNSIAATTTTDANGNFTFIKNATDGAASNGNEFSCPLASTVASPLTYVLAQGGNTQNNGVVGQSNDAAAFIAVYGSCDQLSAGATVDMTEVTTVATMAALQQFFDPVSEGVVADGTGQQYAVLGNVTKTIALLVNAASGSAVTSTVLPAPAQAGHNINRNVAVTATPESSKINHLANILSACINNASASAAGCTSLFSAAVPPFAGFTSNFQDGTFQPATDTLQAIYFILTNPGNGGTANVATLYNLAGGVSGPYQPGLAAQPSDWTIGIKYTTTGATCGTTTGGAGGFISSPYDISIDAADNVWIANSQATSGNLSELTSAGVPNTCVLLGSGGATGSVIDVAGNVWIGSGTNMYRYNPSTLTSTTFPVGVTPLGLAADGAGNVYFTAVSGSTGSLYQLPAAATAATATPLQISSTVGANPIRVMPDYQGLAAGVPNPVNLFVTSGSTFVSEVSPSTASGNLNGFSTTSITTPGTSYGLTLGPGNNLYVSDSTGGTITGLQATGGYTSAVGGFPFTSPATAGISTPTSISIDGRQNIWIPNNNNVVASTGSVSYVSNTATAISPSTGFQKDSTYLNSGRALAVDQAGNVWVAGDGNNFVTEIVGGGVPLFQPYALGLKNNRYQTIP